MIDKEFAVYSRALLIEELVTTADIFGITINWEYVNKLTDYEVSQIWAEAMHFYELDKKSIATSSLTHQNNKNALSANQHQRH